MLSSPACWAAFSTILEREYSNVELLAIHRLTVDTWAVQHPGDGSRLQSVGLHLARLMVQIEGGLTGDEANAAMLAFASRKAELPELPPRGAYRATVADVSRLLIRAITRRLSVEWAEATWANWADQHDFIRSWAARS